MGVRLPSVATTTNLGLYPGSGAETIVATTPPLNIPFDNAQIWISWYVAFNCGTGTTGVQKRLRRGNTLVASAFDQGGIVGVTANTIISLSGCYIDTPGAVGGIQYSLTLAGTGTTGAGGFSDVCMIAYVL